MNVKSGWKVAVIGGGGKIAGAVAAELMDRKNVSGGEVALYSRTPEKVLQNMELVRRICPPEEQKFKLYMETDLDAALNGADIVFYNATAGLEEYGGYKAMGITQGAHILMVGEKVKKICPDAWLMVSTNPPDIPLMAVKKMFELTKLIGLCNAPVIARNTLAEFMGWDADGLQMYDIGVNHDLWFYDIKLQGKSVYQDIRAELPEKYRRYNGESSYFKSFPEWKRAFENNIVVMKNTGYLPCPVGGAKRFWGLPVPGSEISALMKRPSWQDYESCLNTMQTKDDVFAVISRCGGGIPLYIADVLEAAITDSKKEISVQVLNEGWLSQYPEDVMLQAVCGIGREKVQKPQDLALPAYINAVLASRILQNDMVANALAKQDTGLMLQAMLVCPDRVGVDEALAAVSAGENVEPWITLN